jgi:astacin
MLIRELHILFVAATIGLVLGLVDNGDGELWQPSDGTSREDWLRCHGFACDQWARTQSKVKQLKRMAKANGEKADTGGGAPSDGDAANDDSLDGCIWLTEYQVDGIMENLEHQWRAADGEFVIREKRKLNDFGNYLFGLWDMPIAWKFDGNHNFQQRQAIRGAFDHWEQNTCVRFREIGVNEDHSSQHLIITRENTGCHSFIGRVGFKAQQINLQDACIFSFGTIVHEIGHALGLWHEHQRADRDQHVRVLDGNIGAYSGQFIKQRTVSLGVPYDVGSVMHYGSYAASSNGQRTLETLDPLQQLSLGQRTGLSFLDARIINEAYCGGACPRDLPKPCQHG